jgi:hypothetical protein
MARTAGIAQAKSATTKKRQLTLANVIGSRTPRTYVQFVRYVEVRL